MSKETCNQSPAEDHKFTVISINWQTVNPLRYQILEHRREAVVCERCGKVVDPFKTLKDGE